MPPNAPSSPRAPTTPNLQLNEDCTTAQSPIFEIDPHTGKRKVFGSKAKRSDEKEWQKSMDAPTMGIAPQLQPSGGVHPVKHTPDLRPQPIAISPSRHPYHSGIAASPSRLRSSSPRLHSPASSEIFERNVQEPMPISTLQGELSPAHIPTHVITEDHIPPALEASAQAITSEELDPDEVEIVTSASHQPAVVSMLEGSTSHADLTQLHSPSMPNLSSDSSEMASPMHQSGMLAGAPEDDGASNYGQLDPNDVRRLSFISFADVVQSEHQQAQQLSDGSGRDSLYIFSSNHPSSLPGSATAQERAASPLRSPRSPGSSHSRGLTTPPPGVSLDPLGEQSPARSAKGILVGQHGELQIETMRQAVRKTASGDLSGVRSAVGSPISDETMSSKMRSRTNT
ncbi:hypothetical protein M433DRAFT_158383 [Acidomyces richmondensis BFW]|nr:MAG: hypothetical protein FE78DRAFT_85535 [Acidomyces sp. 'richmondensis']KYG42026.1 hypothetical protein M433DRAFT_158383 [Acidomyces richmondensis BFW]